MPSTKSPWQACQFSNYLWRHPLSEGQSALKWETRGEEEPAHANYLIKPEMCLPCLLLHWFSVCPWGEGWHQSSWPLGAFTGFLMCSLSSPLQPLSHLSLFSVPQGRQTGGWYYPAVCLPADSSSLGRRAAAGRDTGQSSSVFMFLWTSVKCCAGSDTTSEDCLLLGRTPHLSALIVRLMEWVSINWLCSVQFRVSKRWRKIGC